MALLLLAAAAAAGVVVPVPVMALRLVLVAAAGESVGAVLPGAGAGRIVPASGNGACGVSFASSCAMRLELSSVCDVSWRICPSRPSSRDSTSVSADVAGWPGAVVGAVEGEISGVKYLPSAEGNTLRCKARISASSR